MKSYVRAFIAVEIAPSIKTEARKALGPMKKAFPGVKWVDDDNFHVTLKFLGPNVPTTELHHIIAAIQKACAKFEQFDLVLEGVGAFPDASSPRTIWLGVTDGVAELRQLAKRIDDELEQYGFPREGREFSPHLTVGRTRQRDREEGQFAVRTSPKNLGNFSYSHKKYANNKPMRREEEVEPGTFGALSRMIYERSNTFFGSSPVDSVILYSSELERGGPKYEALAEIELSPLGTQLNEEYGGFVAAEYDDPNFEIEELGMETHLPETLDTKFDVKALDAEVEDELRAICGEKFVKRGSPKNGSQRVVKPNAEEQKSRLDSIKSDSSADLNSLGIDLSEFAVFKETRSNSKGKKRR